MVIFFSSIFSIFFDLLFFWNPSSFLGCHEVTFAATGTESSLVADVDIFCLPRDITTTVRSRNSLHGRWTFGDDRLGFSMCSNNVSYLRCSARFWVPGPTAIIFSTVSIPLRTPLIASANTPASGFTSQEGLTAITFSIFGVLGPLCADIYHACRNWIVPAITDPLIFWPPPSQVPRFDIKTNVYGEYFNATGAQPLPRTVIGVVLLTVGAFELFPLSQLNNISMSFLSVTNELGEIPMLPNNAVDLTESQSQASASLYMSTISLSSFPRVDLSDLCNETRYNVLQSVVTSEIEEVLGSDSLEEIQHHTVFFF